MFTNFQFSKYITILCVFDNVSLHTCFEETSVLDVGAGGDNIGDRSSEKGSLLELRFVQGITGASPRQLGRSAMTAVEGLAMRIFGLNQQ